MKLNKLLTIQPKESKEGHIDEENGNGKYSKFPLKNQTQDQLAEELIKKISQETGMDKCPVCGGVDVVNEISYTPLSYPPNDTNYTVKHICAGTCKKGWKVTVLVSSSELLHIILAHPQVGASASHILYKVLADAREQIEKFVSHKSEDVLVEEESDQ